MKPLNLTKYLMTGMLACTTPAVLLAQDKETKNEEKVVKQQIVITRTGDESDKTVIEIDGSKVKINGKDAADLKDVNVRIKNLRGTGAIDFGGENLNFNFDLNGPSIFRADSNRAMLGVMTDSHDKGVEIQSVTKESAAEKAGLKKGDVITKIGNRTLETTNDLTDAIRAHKPGEKVSITYLRDGKEQKTTAELGRWKGVNMMAMVAPKVLTEEIWRERMDDDRFEREFRYMPGPNAYLAGPGSPKMGIVVQDTDDGKGVKVIEVYTDGTAHKAGVAEDDIITHVDDKAVNSADEIARIIRAKKDQASVRLQVERNGKKQNIDVRIPKKIKTIDL